MPALGISVAGSARIPHVLLIHSGSSALAATSLRGPIFLRSADFWDGF